MEGYIDLHIHSCYSDGVHTPEVLVAMAAGKGLKAVAIADHDSVSGVSEALAAGERHGVEVIPAVELSIAHGDLRDIHLLGYFIDHRDGELIDRLDRFRRSRDDRARAIVDRINARLAAERRGRIVYEEILEIGRHSVSRLHIARVLVEGGFASTVADAFRRYVGPCDVPKEYFPMDEALAMIRRLKGISVLAHPPTITTDRGLLRSLIVEWAGMGLDGVEVFNNHSYKDDMIFLESLSQDLGLIITGGSDFHGYEDDVEIGRGGLAVEYGWLRVMKKEASERATKP